MTTTELLIPYRSQQTNSWCWAASMKMIMDFHAPPDPADPDTISQCILAKELQKLILGSGSFTAIENAPCCQCSIIPPDSDCSNNKKNAGLATLSLSYNAEADYPGPIVADYFDVLFSNMGFSSIQQINYENIPMTWDQIKKQINDCRPFIINVADAPASAVGNNHSLVVKAFRENPTTNLKVVIANDPWVPCGDYQEVLMPYDDFTESTMSGLDAQQFISNVEATIHTIFNGPISGPVEKTACLSCEALTVMHGDISSVKRTSGNDDVDAFIAPPPSTGGLTGMKSLPTDEANKIPDENPPKNPSSRLLTILDKHGDRVIGYPSTNLKDSSFLKQINGVGYSFAPVEFIDSRLLNRSYLLSCLFPPKELHKVSIPDVRVVEVLNEDIENTLASTFQQSPKGGEWKLRKINTYSSLRKVIKISMSEQDEDSIQLNNKLDGTNDPQQTTFRLIKYYPFQYEFFSFTYDGAEYMAPAADYPELELIPFTAYKEAKVLRTLRRDTREFEKTVKGIFGNLVKYQDYLNLLKESIPQVAPQYSWLDYDGKYSK